MKRHRLGFRTLLFSLLLLPDAVGAEEEVTPESATARIFFATNRAQEEA